MDLGIWKEHLWWKQQASQTLRSPWEHHSLVFAHQVKVQPHLNTRRKLESRRWAQGSITPAHCFGHGFQLQRHLLCDSAHTGQTCLHLPAKSGSMHSLGGLASCLFFCRLRVCAAFCHQNAHCPCVWSQLFRLLRNQSPVFHSLCWKYLEWLLIIRLHSASCRMQNYKINVFLHSLKSTEKNRWRPDTLECEKDQKWVEGRGPQFKIQDPLWFWHWTCSFGVENIMYCGHLIEIQPILFQTAKWKKALS